MSIVIPEELKPADGRFGCGPSKVRPAQIRALAGSGSRYLGTSPDRRPVRSLVRRIRDDLRVLFALPEGYHVVLGAGGVSAFWNVAAYGLIRHRSQHLSCGVFSAMFAEVSRRCPWLEAPSVIEGPPGTHPVPRAEAGTDAYALTHCETSTGVAMPVRRIDAADDDALVLVDAHSAAGGLLVDPAGFDAYYFGPQKCFGAEAGLWVALMSPAALERAATVASSGRYIPGFLSLTAAIEYSGRDLVAGEPSVTGLLLFAEQLDWMLGQGGLPWCNGRTSESARRLYGWAERSPYTRPFVQDPAQRSAVAATIDLDPSVDARAVIQTLRANGIVDLEANRRWGPNQLRAALYPAIDPADIEALTQCIDYVIERLFEG
ncbi:phosphoserine transaminase [Spirillospora sp. NBC_00431]